jgi:hypothetical protein
MLPLNRFVKLVKKADLSDIDHLRVKLREYGHSGVIALLDLLNNPDATSNAKTMALFVLDTVRTQTPTANPAVMAAIEKLAETPDPDGNLDLICFMTVYANAIKLRPEAVALVERFRVGTDRQRFIYTEVDSEFTRKALQMDYLRRIVAAGKAGQK